MSANKRRLAGVAWGLVGLAYGVPVRAEHAGQRVLPPLDPSGMYLVFVLDRSGSMQNEDPQKYNKEAAQLAITIAENRDNLGVISFSSSATVEAKMCSVSTLERRRVMQKVVDGIMPWGGTNFHAALEEAFAMLAEAKAPPQKGVVVFLSDGQHADPVTRPKIPDQIEKFNQHGWKIYSLGLGAEGMQSDLLTQMATGTRGAFYPLRKPELLIDSYLAISGDVGNYWQLGGENDRVEVLPGTSRLAAVYVKASPEADLVGFSDGQGRTRDVSGALRYPPSGNYASLIAYNVPQPQAGLWQPTVTGKGKLIILYQPPFKMEVDPNNPKPEYRRGEPLGVAVNIVFENPAFRAAFDQHSTLQAQLLDKEGQAVGEPFRLKFIGPRGEDLHYCASSPLPAISKGEVKNYSVQVTCRVNSEDGKTYIVHQKMVSFVQLGQPPDEVPLLVDGDLQFGHGWVGGQPPPAKLQLRVPFGATKWKVPSSSAHILAKPAAGTVTEDNPALLEVSLTPPAAEGEVTGTLTFEPDTQKGDGLQTFPPVTVEVRYTAHTFEAPPLALGSFEQQENAMQVKREVAYRVSPALTEKEKGQLKSAELVAPDGTRVRAALTGGNSFQFELPANAQLGDYRGAATILFPGALGEKTVPITLTVNPPTFTVSCDYSEKRPLHLPVFTVKKGETPAAEVAFTPSYPKKVAVLAQPTDLRGTVVIGEEKHEFAVSAKYDVSVKPLGAFDGKTWMPGQGQRVWAYSIYVNSDLPDGEYHGRLRVSFSEADTPKKLGELDIPVTLKVQREGR